MNTSAHSSAAKALTGSFCFAAFLNDSAKVTPENERQWPSPPLDEPAPSAGSAFSLSALLNLPPRRKAATVSKASKTTSHHFFHWHGPRTALFVFTFAGLLGSSLPTYALTRQQWLAAQSAAQQAAYQNRQARLQQEQQQAFFDGLAAASLGGSGIVGTMPGAPVTPGMTDQQVFSVWGQPIETRTYNSQQGPVEVWTYHPLAGKDASVSFINHTVVGVQ